jgi:hypothetical protein
VGKMFNLKVAVNIYGAEDLSEDINIWKTFVEDNSKFNLVIMEKHLPEVEPMSVIFNEETYYWISKGMEHEVGLLPINVHIVILLWKLLEEQTPCWVGLTYLVTERDRPVCSIPYNVYWWDNTPEALDFYKAGPMIILHEFIHALRSIVSIELGFPPLPDPYGEVCWPLTMIECYKLIFGSITDELYIALEQMVFKQRITIVSIPPAKISVDGVEMPV